MDGKECHLMIDNFMSCRRKARLQWRHKNEQTAALQLKSIPSRVRDRLLSGAWLILRRSFASLAAAARHQSPVVTPKHRC